MVVFSVCIFLYLTIHTECLVFRERGVEFERDKLLYNKYTTSRDCVIAFRLCPQTVLQPVPHILIVCHSVGENRNPCSAAPS